MIAAGRPWFASIDAFYRQRGGAKSGESDLGVWWRGKEPYPRYRLSWVYDTGDLYVIELSDRGAGLRPRQPNLHPGEVVLVATIPADTWGDPPDQRFRVLDAPGRPLHGWPLHCGPVGGLGWVIEQTERWAP